MDFENKKEEFIYWMRRSEFAKKENDNENYLIYLQKAQEILKEIENQKKQALI